MITVVLADDHGLYRKGLRYALCEAITEITVKEAETLDEVIELLETHASIDLVLLDLNMPGISCLENLRQFRARCARTSVAILSASTAREDMLGCLSLGVNGFISKIQPESEIVAAVTDLLKGRIYMTPLIAQQNVDGTSPLGVSDAAHVDLAKLTPRQKDVLSLLARGRSNKEIARTLRIAEATTKIHAAALLRVLGVRNRTEAALVARNAMQSGGS